MSGGGYDYDFTVTLPDRLMCKVCHFPSRDPCLSVCCGHTFCMQCSDATRSATKACPICRDGIFPVVRNKQSEREIKSFYIFCSNKEKGCEWQGELNDINNHLGYSDGCQFQEVKCSNECGKMIQRRYLTSHVETECPRRKVNCQYCHDTGEHLFIEGQHKEECPKLPLPCPNKCEFAAILRENMKAHRSVCQLEIVKCLNKCGKQFVRQCLLTHMETECSNRTVECIHCHALGPHSQIKGAQHGKLCPKLPLPCPNKCEVGNVLREDMEAHRKECPLEMIQCEYYSVGCEVRMARKDQEKHDNEKMKEHLMMTKENAFQAKNQLSLMKDHLYLLHKGVINSTDDFIATLISNHPTPHIPVIIRMPSYSQLKETGKAWISSGFIVNLSNRQVLHLSSVPLVISPTRMCLHVCTNGGHSLKKHTHLSVYLYATQGEDRFDVPPEDKFDIKLLNHTDKEGHHIATISRDYSFLTGPFVYKIKSWPACYGGAEKFISLESLNQNSPFLSDDCLYFQVTRHDSQ